MARLFNIVVIAVIFTILVALALESSAKGHHKKHGNGTKARRNKNTNQQNVNSSPVKTNSDASRSVIPASSSLKELPKSDVKTTGGSREGRNWGWGGHNGYNGYNGGYNGGYGHHHHHHPGYGYGK